jgi:hypothetical protein
VPHPSGADPERHLDDEHVLLTATLEETTLVSTYRVRAETVFFGEIAPDLPIDFREISGLRELEELRIREGRRVLLLRRHGQTFRPNIHWWMHAPVAYFEKNYPDFLPALPVIVRGEAIADPAAKTAAKLRALASGNVDVAAWAVRGAVARWTAGPPGSEILEEIEEALREVITSTSRDFGLRFYTLMQLMYLRSDRWPSRLIDPLLEIASGERELRARALMTLRVLAENATLGSADRWRTLVPRLVELVVEESATEAAVEEAAKTIAVIGGDDLAPIVRRIAPSHPGLATAILEHWRTRGPLNHARFRVR